MQAFKQNPNCDGGHCITDTGTVRVLPLAGHGNLHLCYACWMYEMQWRTQRNRELAEDVRYPIPDWLTLKPKEVA